MWTSGVVLTTVGDVLLKDIHSTDWYVLAASTV